MNIKRNANGFRIGGHHHRARLTDHEVSIFRRLIEQGVRLCVAAKVFEISKGYASKLARGLAR